jgi:hypothetical protein
VSRPATSRRLLLLTRSTAYKFLEGTFLPSKQEGLNRAAGIMMEQIVRDAGLLHGFLYAQLVRNKAARRAETGSTDYQILACYHKAVQHANVCLADKQSQCSDFTILLVMFLAHHGKAHPRDDLAQKATQGPLKSLQLLDLYGGLIDPEPTHEKGLRRMIELRGGLHTLTLPGLARMLS